MRKRFYSFLPGLLIFLTPWLAAAQCDPSHPEIPLNGVDEDCDGLDDIFLFMPPYIYLAEGQDFELYFRNTILSRHPQDYVFTVSTALDGLNSGDKWSFLPPPGLAGEFPLTLTVAAPDGQVLASAGSLVRITPAAMPPDSSAKRLLLFGHSFFDQGYLPLYLHDLTRQPGNPPITFHGKKESWANPLARHEGYGGMMARWFFREPASPVRYGDRVDLRRYFDEVTDPGHGPDWVVFHLDINDFCGYSALAGLTLTEIDDSITADWDRYATRLIDSMRAASPHTRIAVCLSPMPNARESAFQITYEGNPVLNDRWRWQKIISRLLFRNAARYAGREGENIFLLPEHLDLDDFAEYNPVDARHPDPPDQNPATHCGYREIAKSIYAWIRWAAYAAEPPAWSTFFRDADADGYGDPAESLLAAAAPAGYVPLSGDCDDDDPGIHPGAAEDCANNRDENCDGQVDEDLVAPMAACRDTVLLPLDAAGTALLAAADLDGGCHDACSAPTLALSRSQFDCLDRGWQAVGLKATDASGNEASCSALVRVIDTLAPVLICPDLRVNPGPAALTLTDLGAMAADNCGGWVWDSFEDLLVSCQQLEDTLSLALTARDESGNAATCTVRLIVADTIDTDGDGQTDCLDACPGVPGLFDPVTWYADDDHDGFGDGDAQFSCLPPAGAVWNGLDCDDQDAAVHPGQTEVCANGRDDDCDGEVDEDGEPPTALCRDSIRIFLDAAGQAVLSPSLLDNGSFDDCPDLHLEILPANFTCQETGSAMATLSVADGAGNSAFCTGVVTVADTLTPWLTCPDRVVALGPADQVTVTLTGLGATVSDNCGARWLPFDDLVLSRQHVGVKTIVRLTATDEAGHTATCTLRIFVVDSVDADGVARCPDAPERLDGLDDNCHGRVDEGSVDVSNMWKAGNGVKLFPVPSRDRLNVECFSRQKSVPYLAWITGATGQVMRTFREADFSGYRLETDLTALPPGIYLLEIVFKDGRTAAARFQKI